MIIKKITLCNFGSYEGVNTFSTDIEKDRKIILFGGKNGAGKTTLFTAIRVCLYGYISMGYKSKNAYYLNAIKKLINNNAKLRRPTDATISLTLKINRGTWVDEYLVTRSWMLDDALTEYFYVKRNGEDLSTEEIADFEKYIFNAIPPELFNLYFFDGERIADFFLKSDGTKHLKEAFLTLCGYDIFDIMQANFKRTAAANSKTNYDVEAYTKSKEEYSRAEGLLSCASENLKYCKNEIENCELSIQELEKESKAKGIITQEEWADLLSELKEQELKREKLNSLLKKWANDIIPFIVLRDEMVGLKEQLEKELDNQKYSDFKEVLSDENIIDIIGAKSDTGILEKLNNYAEKRIAEAGNSIIGISADENILLSAKVNELLAFDEKQIAETKEEIKESIARTAEIRSILENNNTTLVEKYMQRKNELLEEKNNWLQKQIEIEQEYFDAEQTRNIAFSEFEKTKKEYEQKLKSGSIEDISTKSIIMLDKIRKNLYSAQIRRVEQNFLSVFSILMYKENFIDDIWIDEKFDIHIYRNKSFTCAELYKMHIDLPDEEVRRLLGEKAVKELQNTTGGNSFVEHVHELPEKIVLPVEIDKTSLSNGEKQIFIMALYYSLMQLGNHEIPFIIDTPFARIDKEHRNNISEHFFRSLNGQVFILSTDEEIDSDHLRIMSDRIEATYLLENKDNKKTIISGGKYFEV